VTPAESNDAAAVKSVSELWTAVGARVVTLEPEGHDRAVAAISHLPHVVAWALVDAVARFEPDAFAVAARGFKDTTRIAASDPDVWREILLGNRDAVVASVAAFRQALDDLERLVAQGDGATLTALLARVKAMRERLS
jgi:prephenate dehydrogenase